MLVTSARDLPFGEWNSGSSTGQSRGLPCGVWRVGRQLRCYATGRGGGSSGSSGVTPRGEGNGGAVLVEILVGLGILIVVLVSLFAGISTSFNVTQVARENLRATQIMLERMETIRLHTWNQLIFSNMIPATTTASYYPLALSGESSGVTYQVNVAITNAAMNPPTTYGDRMRTINVTVFWTNYYGSTRKTNLLVRSRSMTTYSARDGVQNYIYDN